MTLTSEMRASPGSSTTPSILNDLGALWPRTAIAKISVSPTQAVNRGPRLPFLLARRISLLVTQYLEMQAQQTTRVIHAFRLRLGFVLLRITIYLRQQQEHMSI